MEELVPIVALLSVALVLCCVFFFRYRSRADVQQTVRAAIEQGQPLSPEMLEALGTDFGGQRDLRKGVVLIAVALGISGMALGLAEADLLGIAAIPAFIGLGYLLLWRLTSAQKR
ncbi:MAG: DUF6249 domain-containing protein [Pseudomonadales bacterium]|nr:hypothetical protein [Pseudomonadales bacterium]